MVIDGIDQLTKVGVEVLGHLLGATTAELSQAFVESSEARHIDEENARRERRNVGIDRRRVIHSEVLADEVGYVARHRGGKLLGHGCRHF